MIKINPKDLIEPRASELVEKIVAMPSGDVTFHILPLSASDLATMRIMMMTGDNGRVSGAIAWEINRSVVFPDGSRVDSDGNEALPIDVIKTFKQDALFAILEAIRQVNEPATKS